MPLIKPRTRRLRYVRHTCRLQELTRNALVLYARFIGDTADYVLNEVLEATILRDREFLAWRAEQPVDRPTAAPERRAAPASSDDAL